MSLPRMLPKIVVGPLDNSTSRYGYNVQNKGKKTPHVCLNAKLLSFHLHSRDWILCIELSKNMYKKARTSVKK